MKEFKIVIEKYFDGYVAYLLGVVGAVVGQGETYEEALVDVKSAPVGSVSVSLARWRSSEND